MTDRFNTIAGWTLFAGIVALGLSSISSRIFNADSPASPEQPGYFIEGGADEGGADSGPSLALLLAEGSPDDGERVFAKCMACHTIEQGGADGIGPNLYGVLGTQIATHVPGFAYSSALADKGGEWDYENMSEWLASPRAFAPGTKMSFAGLSNPEERADLILYMREHGGGPALPEPEAPAEEPAEGEEAAAPAEGEEAAAEGAEGEASDAAAEDTEASAAEGESSDAAE